MSQLDDIRAADGMADYTMTECERQRRYLLGLVDKLMEVLPYLVEHYHDYKEDCAAEEYEMLDKARAAIAEARK